MIDSFVSEDEGQLIIMAVFGPYDWGTLIMAILRALEVGKRG